MQMCVCVCVCVCVRENACQYLFLGALCMWLRVWVSMRVCLCVSFCVCVICVCVFAHVHMCTVHSNTRPNGPGGHHVATHPQKVLLLFLFPEQLLWGRASQWLQPRQVPYGLHSTALNCVRQDSPSRSNHHVLSHTYVDRPLIDWVLLRY